MPIYTAVFFVLCRVCVFPRVRSARTMKRQQAIVSVAFGLRAAVGMAETFSGLGAEQPVGGDELFTACGWSVPTATQAPS